MIKRKRIVLRVESLETLTLMAATLPALPGLAPGSTGLGSVGTVTVSDVQALQQDASGGALELYISQLENVYGRRANVKQFASAVIANHSTTNYDLENVAGASGVSLPAGIGVTSDVRSAQRVLDSVRSGNVDATYLSVLKQINAQDVANDQYLTTTTQDGNVRAYASETQGYDQSHLQGAQQLSRNTRSTYTSTAPTVSITKSIGAGSGTPASTSDTQALQMDESGGALEVFISQVEEQYGKRSDAQQFAQTVVADHQVTNYDLQATAVATNVTLPSGITQASDIKYAQTVLNAVRSGNVDSAYIKTIAAVNATDISNDQQLIASSQSPQVTAYAQETLMYDMTHLQGAQKLSSQKSSTYVPSM